MSYGVITQPIVPGRKEPSDKSEMVTQLLFGERYTLMEHRAKWILVQNEADDYQCWIDAKQHQPLDEKDHASLREASQKRCGDAIGFLSNESGHRFAVPCSALLAGYSEGKLRLGGKSYLFDGRIARHDEDSIMRHARRLLHAPYLWGGKSALGIDCSGLVQVVFACAGKMLPRDAYQQAEHGESVDFVDLAQKGDLLFFENEEGHIHHVGIATGDGHIIHASGEVRIDRIDHEGIYHSGLQKYTHRLRLIKRV